MDGACRPYWPAQDQARAPPARRDQAHQGQEIVAIVKLSRGLDHDDDNHEMTITLEEPP